MNRIFCLIIFICLSINLFSNTWLRINQVGYLEKDIKVAVLISKEKVDVSEFVIIDAESNQIVYSGNNIRHMGQQPSFDSASRLYFTEFEIPGRYYIKVNEVKSDIFKIGNDVYIGASEIPLQYMRQQRCGYNPFLRDSCHMHDAITVADPDDRRNGLHYDVTGGWHDASDYLQYVATSSNAVYQMLFAYMQNPEVFEDNYDADGNPGANGIPDILDEAKWGLDWLIKMNPDSITYFNQIADDRDHQGFILPNEQMVDYGWGEGKERPVYFVSPRPQGLFKYKNRSTGMASTMGKFASSFALGARILSDYYPGYSKLLLQKAEVAYLNGVVNPGVSQTAPGGAPYFYEEDNWADDMELAATQLFSVSQENKYLQDAINYGRLEPITPWMGADSARHYQWYPFVNLGHYHIARQEVDLRARNEFVRNMRSGLQRVKDRAEGDAFFNGIPFIWCSNNLTIGFITQCRLYYELTNDDSFLEIETAMRDWIFGCNPWGASMVVGYPENGDTPTDPHSAFTHLHNMPITGGLVDGPIYNSIFSSLIGIYLANEDKYAEFQSDRVVYHDDFADYSTNEPTMDGTASMTYYLGYLASVAKKNQLVEGGITRGDRTRKQISLVFTGHEYADGGQKIRKTLKENDVIASFFLTGDFYRSHSSLSKSLYHDGHYMGPHSDKHLLLADWEDRSNTLISRDEFRDDLLNNYTAMEQLGITKSDPLYYLPPYEWYNNEISTWAKEEGVQVINFTQGTRSNADYTTPDMQSYLSSLDIYSNIISQASNDGLNGHILLLHIGTDSKRKDKLYDYLDKMVKELKGMGYEFVSINDLLSN